METPLQPYKLCSMHTGEVAVACQLIRRLTHEELQGAGKNAPPGAQPGETGLMARQAETITKSVIALGVLGCAYSEGELINQLTERPPAPG